MAASRRRILLVVDGSYQSYEVINYISEALPPKNTAVVLLHVTSKVPEAFWDLEKDPVWQQKVQTVRGWEVQQENKIRDFMDRARQVFKDAAFPDEAITVDVRGRREGIARDIGAESHRGYDAVILGRRGLSTIQGLALGGVASKVVLKVSDMAVWLIGGRPEPDRIIIGMDSSEGCQLAVQHVASITAGLNKRVLLLHVVRRLNGDSNGLAAGMEELQKEREARAAREMEAVFKTSSGKLMEAGIPEKNIETKILTGVSSRAGAILDEAKAGGYGTIVIGRRGVSTVEEFSMGRVTNKLVQAAKDRALWIVG
ncbi:MAG: universal stress protein [Desulfobacteraceae bacterium]|nr:universal stress protein [Desulfobacteraceae bacterium]